MISNNNVSDNHSNRMDCITIGRLAPDFTALSTEGPITLSQYRGKWVILFSAPGDFAPIATTEMISFAQLFPEFDKRNVQIIGMTIDSNFADIEWLYDIFIHSGIIIPFPIISDRDTEISRLYGIVNPDRIYEESVRDIFIINPAQRIRAIITYPVSCGINSYELLRVIDSLQLTEEYNLYTPSNWMPGDPTIVPPPHTFTEAMQRFNEQESLGLHCNMWYSCFKNSNTNNK